MHRILRWAAITAALIAGLTVTATSPAAAAPAAPIGPECAENVRAAVLAAVAGRVTPGQVIQYLQITADGRLKLCVVTVPS